MPKDAKILTEIILDIRDMKKKMNSVGADAKTLGKGFKKAFTGAQASMAKFGLAINGIKSAVNMVAGPMRMLIEYGGAQVKVNEQLARVIKSTGNVAGVTADEMRDMADALQQATVYGNEEVQVAQNILLTFKQISGEVLPRVTKVVLDTAYAMDTGLKETSIQVGKALNDPIIGLTALARVGITFTEQQKDQIKAMSEAGDMAGAQAIILEELESQFGGSSEAIKNWYGSIIQAKNAVGDLIEVIADKFGPVFKAAAHLVKGLSETLISWLAVPVSQKLQEERVEFNHLMNGLRDTNIAQETRNRLIKTLQEKYSGYLENINLETASYDDLTASLKRANFQFDQQIRYHALQELAGKTFRGMTEYRMKAEDLQLWAIDQRVLAERAAALKIGGYAKHMGQAVVNSQKSAILAFLEEQGALGIYAKAYESTGGIVNASIEKINGFLSDYMIQRTSAADNADSAAQQEMTALDELKTKWGRYQSEMSLLMVPEELPEPLGGAPTGAAPAGEEEQLSPNEAMMELARQRMQTMTDDRISAAHLEKNQLEVIWGEYWEGYVAAAAERMTQLRSLWLNTVEDMVVTMMVKGDSLKDVWVGVRDQLITATAKWALHEMVLAAGVENFKTAITAKGTTARMAIKSKEILADMWSLIVNIGRGFASLGPWALLAIPAAIYGTMAVLKGFMSAAKSLKFFGDGGVVREATLAVVGEKGPEVITPIDVLDAAFRKHLGAAGGGGWEIVSGKLDRLITLAETRRTIIRGTDLVAINDGLQQVKVRTSLG